MRTLIKISAGSFALLGLLAILSAWSNTTAYLQAIQHPEYQLLVASLNGNTQAVRQLLQNGADPNTPPGPQDKGMTALMFAAWRGHGQIVRLLLDAGANPNALSDNSSSPLMYAAAAGNVQIVNALLNNGANANFVSQGGNAAILLPLTSHNVSIVRSLATATQPSVLNNLSMNGDPLIIATVKMRNPELVGALLLTTINLEVRDSTGQTALMYAARGGHTQIVSKLLRKGANVNARDSRGVTSLTKAIIGNRIAVVQVLRAHGARS